MVFRSVFLMSCFVVLSSCTKNQNKIDAGQSEQALGPKWVSSSPVEELGYHLYFEKRLSADNSISCNTCHDVTKGRGGVDGLPTSTGIGGQKGGRNAPTVWNAVHLSVQFWDGRAKDLVEQAKGPITNPIEMGMKDHNAAIEKIRAIKGYQELFAKAFPGDKEAITIENLAKAIAAFESTLVTVNSPFDKKEMSAEAQKGYEVFQSVGCISCHSGPHFAGPELPVGSGFYMKFPTFADKALESKYEFSKDPGRFEVTKNAADKNMWRVPTLRNVARTAPYFHNGRVDELDEAVRIMAKLQLSRELTDEQVEGLVAFLKSLNGVLPTVEEPTEVL